MRRNVLMLVLAWGAVAVVALAPHFGSGPREAGAAPVQGGGSAPRADNARANDEAAIRANVEAFVKAYNAHDPKAIAALFTPEGVLVQKDGDVVEGRTQIEQAFAAVFANAPKCYLEVYLDQIRFLGPDLAVETGHTKEIEAPGESPESDRYTVLHVKRDGKWYMALARDSEGEEPSHHERLQPLAWMVGDWIDDGGSTVVRSTCKWSDCGNYLLQEFQLEIAGEHAMNVSQRIGWDPLAKQIRAWVFDSEGGYGESRWVRSGQGWIIKATGVRADGGTGSATNILVPAGNDGYVFRSTDRIVGGEAMPPMEVKVVRKPPQPKP
ncbi:MAG TPA: SgcJ/EcaC family oxidoreductase [Gemmatales bacterium]|nr:SgcJ/EcaC family oxidoreductase [Gemmatales bacterium]HMP60237.1 SgcJ/EcaC family oxidoreductase [Gemmatales bacterium]